MTWNHKFFAHLSLHSENYRTNLNFCSTKIKVWSIALGLRKPVLRSCKFQNSWAFLWFLKYWKGTSCNIFFNPTFAPLGPASKQVDFLKEMIYTGMNVARMNFSHGSYDYHGDTMNNCREAAKKYKEETGFDPCLTIALDTKGPEIR